MFLHPFTLDNDSCLLVGCVELLRDMRGSTMRFHKSLHFVTDLATGAVRLEPRLGDLVLNVHGSDSTRYTSNTISANTIISVIIVAVNLRYGSEEIVLTRVLRIRNG